MTDPAAILPKGTQPEGAKNQQEASEQVRKMFTRIAPRYDLLNHLLSAQMDRLWRARTARELAPILERPGAVVLDLCCGTGDLAFAMERKAKAKIIGADFSHTMLVRAREKAQSVNRSSPMPLFEADALHLPFAGNSFDLVTSAFGFRNLANYEGGLREFARVLRRDGELGILEFTEPESGPMAGLFRFYFKNVLPRIGGAISGDQEAYAYLPGSVSKFPPPSELAALMEKTGFADVHIASWNFGSVILHSARRS